MQIKLWGTRGSLPRAMTDKQFQACLLRFLDLAQLQGVVDLSSFRDFVNEQRPLTFGGNTTCTEIIHEEHSYFVDFGTGLVSYVEINNKPKKHYSFFLSHLHWDHINGLPFFPPLYDRQCQIDIYHVHNQVEKQLASGFNGINFPVRWQELDAEIRFHQLVVHRPLNLNAGLTVTPFKLDHPGDSFGYRFEQGDKSLAIAVDNELQRKTADELGEDRCHYRQLDLLIFDSQYELSELAHKYDWGHSSPTLGIDLAYREMIKKLVLVHHDPWADDQKLQAKVASAQDYARKVYPKYRQQWQKVQEGGPKIIAGYDGLEIDVS